MTIQKSYRLANIPPGYRIFLKSSQTCAPSSFR
nr:MAG TPA: Transcription-silencing protein, cryptic loci regulator Clr2 [Caudoviricetes sp.]